MSFFLKKVLSYFVLPPGLFVLLFLVIAFLSGKKLVRRLAFSGALALYLISVEPVKDLLYYPLESPYRVPERVEADAIVVLGGGVYNNGRLKASSYKRLITAFLLHRETGLPLILSGGASLKAIPEAEVMKKLLLAFGVSEEKIFADLMSRDTGENARFVSEICRRKNWKKIALVTSAFHMRRASELFRREGFQVIPYPTDFKFEGRYNFYSVFPKYSVFYDSSIAIREYLAILFYSLRGLL
ncbi:MAG: YdcF family protein [Aquificae bacterium]|nr:YdcF family protein [Aquificota bacterium]